MQMDPNYPRDMKHWHGIPSNLDAAVTSINGKFIIITCIYKQPLVQMESEVYEQKYFDLKKTFSILFFYCTE